ncbi:MAG: hypothetical protein R3F39_20965 [Myxococcota bacterium]
MARSDEDEPAEDSAEDAAGGDSRQAGVREVGKPKTGPREAVGAGAAARDAAARDAGAKETERRAKEAERRADEAARQAADAEGGRDGRAGVSEGLRKALASGIRMALSADDVIRDAVPREVLSHVMRQTDSAKDEVVRVVGVQIRKFLENLDIAGEVQKILTSVSFEVRTEIRFIPNDQGLMPKPRVKVKSAARGPGAREESAADKGGGRSEAGKPGERQKKSRLGAAVDKALGVFTRELEDEDDVLDDAPDETDER